MILCIGQNYLQQTNLFKSDEDLKDEFDDSRETVASLIQVKFHFAQYRIAILTG